MAAAEEPLFGGAAAGVAAAAGAHGGDAWDDGYFGDAGGGGGGASDMEDDEPPNDALGGWEDGDGEDGRGMGRWAEGGVPPMALLGGGDEARADGDDGQSYEELCRWGTLGIREINDLNVTVTIRPTLGSGDVDCGAPLVGRVVVASPPAVLGGATDGRKHACDMCALLTLEGLTWSLCCALRPPGRSRATWRSGWATGATASTPCSR